MFGFLLHLPTVHVFGRPQVLLLLFSQFCLLALCLSRCFFFLSFFYPGNWLNWPNGYQNGMYSKHLRCVSDFRLKISEQFFFWLVCDFYWCASLGSYTSCRTHFARCRFPFCLQSALTKNCDHFVIRVNRTSSTYVIFKFQEIRCFFIICHCSVHKMTKLVVGPRLECMRVCVIDDNMWFNKLNKFTRNSVAFNTNNETPNMVLIQQPLHSISGCVCVAARTGDNKMIFDIRKRKFRIIMRSMFSTLETHYKWYIAYIYWLPRQNRSIYFYCV